MTALANEGARVLEDGYAIRASDIDVIYCFGFGFPRHRGGPMFYGDTVGLPTVLARVNEYRRRFGDYWNPAPLLERLADATEDRQWIHIDPKRAAAESPFETTIAHGFLTLSLVSVLTRHALSFGNVRMAINYGLNRVRFVSPVPAGARIRGRFTPIAVVDADGGVQVTWSVTIEREHSDKPCLVAEWIVRYYPRESPS
jgi:acyl dehydratase